MDIKLVVLSPERELLSVGADRVELPGAMGRFVVLKDHAPLISSLVAGEILYNCGDERGAVAVSSGFVRVKDNVVTACVEL